MQSSILVVIGFGLMTGILQLTYANHLDNNLDDSIGGGYLVRTCSSCARDECRVMGMQRFSQPRCEQLGGVGSPCRMWQEPENKTLHFPNAILECDNVYMQFCPCSSGLICDDSTCKNPDQQLFGPIEEELNEDEIHEAFRPSQFQYPWAVRRFH